MADGTVFVDRRVFIARNRLETMEHRMKRGREEFDPFIEEVRQLAGRFAVTPWLAHEPTGADGLRQLAAAPCAANENLSISGGGFEDATV